MRRAARDLEPGDVVYSRGMLCSAGERLGQVLETGRWDVFGCEHVVVSLVSGDMETMCLPADHVLEVDPWRP